MLRGQTDTQIITKNLKMKHRANGRFFVVVLNQEQALALAQTKVQIKVQHKFKPFSGITGDIFRICKDAQVDGWKFFENHIPGQNAGRLVTCKFMPIRITYIKVDVKEFTVSARTK